MAPLIIFILILSFWFIEIILLPFANDYITLLIFTFPFIISLLIINPLLSFYSDLKEILILIEIIIGILIIYQFYSLIIN